MNRRTNSRQSNQSGQEKKWINSSIAVMAYLQDFREITKNNKTFMVCDLNAVETTSQGNIYHRFSCYVIGEKAQELLWEVDQDLSDKRKVLVGALLRGMKPSIFTHAKGKRQGQQDVSFQSNLMYIDWMRVDNEEIYKVKPEEREEDQRLSIPQYEDNQNDVNDEVHDEDNSSRRGQSSRRSSDSSYAPRSTSRGSRSNSSGRSLNRH